MFIIVLQTFFLSPPRNSLRMSQPSVLTTIFLINPTPRPTPALTALQPTVQGKHLPDLNSSVYSSHITMACLIQDCTDKFIKSE